MFVLPSISKGLEFSSVNHISIDEKWFLVETSNNWPNDLLGTNVYKTLEFCWELLLTILQCTNTASVISK